MIHLGSTVFDRSAQLLLDSVGTKLPLPAQSARVLECLIEANGALVSKDLLVSQVWGSVAVTDDSLVQCIGEIRNAIGDTAHEILQTEHRRGYRLVRSTIAPTVKPTSAEGMIPPAIAVMAFTSMDGNERSERRAMAFSGDLITELAKYKGHSVEGRSSRCIAVSRFGQ
jgi:DNA-binding winged helix-turn-helix (wHTH) protein